MPTFRRPKLPPKGKLALGLALVIWCSLAIYLTRIKIVPYWGGTGALSVVGIIVGVSQILGYRDSRRSINKYAKNSQRVSKEHRKKDMGVELTDTGIRAKRRFRAPYVPVVHKGEKQSEIKTNRSYGVC